MHKKITNILCKATIIAAYIMQSPTYAAPPTSVSVAVNGTCNQTVTNSSGGTYILYCPQSDTKIQQARFFKVVIGFTAKSPILDGQIDWRFVDKKNSDISIYVDDKLQVYEDLNKAFADEVLTLKRGEHTFRIETSFSYHRLPGGFQPDPSDATCTVVLDVQAPGKVFPKFNISQDNSGALLPLDCSFKA